MKAACVCLMGVGMLVVSQIGNGEAAYVCEPALPLGLRRGLRGTNRLARYARG